MHSCKEVTKQLSTSSLFIVTALSVVLLGFEKGGDTENNSSFAIKSDAANKWYLACKTAVNKIQNWINCWPLRLKRSKSVPSSNIDRPTDIQIIVHENTAKYLSTKTDGLCRKQRVLGIKS